MLAELFQRNVPYKDRQLRYHHVKTAYAEHLSTMLANLQTHQVSVSDLNVLLRVFKEERTVELWIKAKKDAVFHFVKSFPILALSGLPGPKKNKNDQQVPEGFYRINKLLPQSSCCLGATIHFPNVADGIILRNAGLRVPAKENVYLYGEENTKGNIRLSNNHMKELYIYLVEAKNNDAAGIPIHIFPFKMTPGNREAKALLHKNDSLLIRFWDHIEPGYFIFENSHTIARYSYSRMGYWFR